MKPYDHCEFEHEYEAFKRLEREMPKRSDLELYPSVYLLDRSRKVYHECDLLVVAESFAAVVELKHWRGEIEVADNVWKRDGVAIRDPHETNLPKAKVFKGLLEEALPASHVPFVQSIVVLTAENGEVRGADSAFDVIKRIDEGIRNIGDHLTFDGIDELAKYLRERAKRDAAAGRQQITTNDFTKLTQRLDARFADGPRREDYADQISGFRIRREIEHTARYVSYLAEANPPRGDMLYRLRVFGPVSSDPAEEARQFRSLDTLERLPPHPHIRPTHRHPNERNLVVEVCPWNDVQTLDQVLNSSTTVSGDFAVRVTRDLARALAHVHADHRLIHRNLSPRSVIVGRDDHVELTNFDLAFDVGADYTVVSDDLSELERHYMAPEALAGSPDIASDTFSLGRLLEKLLGCTESDEENVNGIRSLAQKMKSLEAAARPSAETVAHQLSEYLGENLEQASTIEPSGPQEPKVGDTYDTWELKGELGRGGSSWVFYGESHNFPAALKIFRSEVPRDRCLVERDLLRQAKSPFIAGFHSFTQWAGQYWCIVQEYAEGENLRALIERGDRPDASLFVEVARQMLTALDALHTPSAREIEEMQPGRSVIHNDVTPGNIVLNRERRVAKLVDFGMASAHGLTVIGGTPGYVARDLLTKDGYMASPQGDLYSLTVTLVEWATGQRSDDIEIPPLAEEFGATVAERLVRVLRAALQPTQDLLASASAMQQALEAAIEPREEAATIPSSDLEAPSHARETVRETLSAGRVAGSEDAQHFVEYLNSIHNVSANNRYALAEAQATSEYFQDLHVELDLSKKVREVLAGNEDVVIVLTGHAGDGKSTVALDLLKGAWGIDAKAALPEAPSEIEYVELNGRPVTIVKDMSELAADVRLKRLSEAIEGPGSALIVSNTGPLMGTFQAYFSQTQSQDSVEQDVLQRLSQPLNNGALGEENSFPSGVGKKIYLANLSMLDNVQTACSLLNKLIRHPAWENCAECIARGECPIRQNVELLRETEALVQERVRYVYERLTAYGRRMTMRQIAAHLSFSLTAGLSCEEVLADPAPRWSRALFSESFFGKYGGRTEEATDALFCVKQMSDLHFGANSSPPLDQLVHEGKLTEALEVPSRLETDVQRWQNEARDPTGGESRRRLRRLAYVFGRPRAGHDWLESVLIDEFLHSPMLRRLARWVADGSVETGLEKRKFIKKTIGVLMEEFIGYMVPEGVRERLFITLRRLDERVFQPVQVVLKTIPVDEFELSLDAERGLPTLRHGTAELVLTLPLLDYIDNRSRGELTGDLDAIHRASLEVFRGELLGTRKADPDVITVLEVNASGETKTHKFSTDDNGQKLVYQ